MDKPVRYILQYIRLCVCQPTSIGFLTVTVILCLKSRFLQGKGSFYGTDLEVILVAQGIRHLFVCGVTTEVCVHTTVREANDRGYHCIVVEDACASFFDDFHDAAIRMIVAQDGIFGSTTDSTKLCDALRANGQS